ncbi:MAG: hypothetical protein EOO07_13685 [Chitinophagaceae bacterium]|nr:MAG: hypothetical protein EOO07_13685 [Chitinophagaceae bacterium]
MDYLLGKDRDRADARLDRGDPEQMIELIDSSNYAQKYKSGVLSFAERDLDEHQKQAIMDSFERVLFPGLDKDQYSILWVQHLDKDRLELNFVVASVELQTGKRLQPYYDRADRPRLNAWKDLVNDHYKLHDPNDPINKRELCTPNNLPKTKIKACEAITNGLLGVAERGDLKNRDDVIKTLENAGFEIARTTKKSISIKDPDGGQNIRLKGAIYEQDFRFSKELRADIERASQEYRADRGNRVQEARKTLDRLTERKRGSNQLRYPRTEQTPTADYVKDLGHRSHSRYDSSFSDVGNFSLSESQNQGKRRADRPTEHSYPRISGQGGQYQATGLHRQQEPQTLMYSNEQGRRDFWQRQSNDSNGVLNDDRVRERITQRTGTDAERATSTTESFMADVREYQTRQSERQGELQKCAREYQRSRPDQKHQFEQISTTCEQLERSVAGLQDTKQSLDRAITGIGNASKQVEKMNEPKRSYGIGR